MGLITPSIGLIFWTSLAFIILLVLLAKFAWKPILGALSEREKSIEDALNSAEKAREEMAQLSADNERLINEAKEEQGRILKEAQAAANTIVNDAKDKAVVEVTALKEKAAESIAAEKKAALADIKKLSAELSLSIAEKVLRGELKDKSAQESLVEKYISEVDLTKA